MAVPTSNQVQSYSPSQDPEVIAAEKGAYRPDTSNIDAIVDRYSPHQTESNFSINDPSKLADSINPFAPQPNSSNVGQEPENDEHAKLMQAVDAHSNMALAYQHLNNTAPATDKSEILNKVKNGQPVSPTDPGVLHEADGVSNGMGFTDKMSAWGAFAINGAVHFAGQAVGTADLFIHRWKQMSEGTANILKEQADKAGIPYVNLLDAPNSVTGADPKELQQKYQEFSDWINHPAQKWKKLEDKSDLYQAAMHSPGLAPTLGKYAGDIAGIAATIAVLPGNLGGVGQEMRILAPKLTTKAIELANSLKGEAASTLSKAADQTAIDTGAASVINHSKTAKAFAIARLLGKGAILGETTYNPEENHYIDRAITGGMYNMLLPFGGALTKKFAGPVAQAVVNFSKDYGIDLNIFPKMEQLSKFFPFSGYAQLIVQRGKALGEGMKNITDIGAEGTTIGTGREGAAEQAAIAVNPDTFNLNNWDSFFNKEGRDSVDHYSKLYDDGIEKIKENNKNSPAITINDLPKNIDIAQIKNNLSPSEKQDFEQMGFEQKLNFLQSKMSMSNPTSSTAKVASDILVNQSKYIDYFQDSSLQKISRNLLDSPQKSFEDLLENKRALGKAASLSKDNNAKKQLWRLYHAINDDLKSHLDNTNPGDAAKFDALNKMYHDRVALFRNSQYFPTRNDANNANGFVSKFVLNKPMDHSLAYYLKFMKDDGERTKTAIKAAYINEAMQFAHNKGIGINPHTFINRLLGHGARLGEVFSPEELDSFRGYQKFTNVIAKVSPEAIKPDVAQGWVKAALHLSRGHIYEAMAGLGAGKMAMTTGHWGLFSMFSAPSAFFRLMNSSAGRKLMIGVARKAQDLSVEELHPILKKALKIAIPMVPVEAAKQGGSQEQSDSEFLKTVQNNNEE